jgi:hypothetical protein
LAHAVTVIDKDTDTFDTWLTSHNIMANVFSQEALTANNNANGAYVIGNSFVFGIFGANDVAVSTSLRGGNVQSTNTLYVTSNVWANDVSLTISVGNSTVNSIATATNAVYANGLTTSQYAWNQLKVGSNAVINLTTISLGNTVTKTTVGNNSVAIGNSSANATINSTSITVANVITTQVAVGSNVTVATDKVLIGNSTSNALVNSSVVTLGSNLTLNSTSVAIGNSTANLFANSSKISLGANVSLSSSQLAFGNSTVNTIVNSTSFYINGSPVVSNTSKMSVSWENTLIANRAKINFIAGNNVFLDVTDDNGDGQINVQINAVATSGAAIIGGTNSAIQINSNMNFGGDANKLSFDLVNSTLVCSNNITSNVFQLSQSVILASGQKAFVSSAGPDTIDSFAISTFRSVDYVYSIKNNSANAYQAGKLLVLSDGTNASLAEYAINYSNSLLGTFDVSSNSTHILLQFTPTDTLSYTVTVKSTNMPV